MTRRPTLLHSVSAAGLAVGLAIGGYGLASAASPGPAPNPGAPAAPGTGAPKGERPGLKAAASAIGIPVADLQNELAAGKTIAAVAAEHHVDVAKVIDAMVAEAQPVLRQRITGEVNGQFAGRGPRGPMGPFGHGADRDASLGVAASTLNMAPADLKAALAGGQTLAQIAQAKGVDPQKLIDALVTDQTTRLDQAVKDGKLTQAQADRIKTSLSQRVADRVNGVHRAWGPGGPGEPPPPA